MYAYVIKDDKIVVQKGGKPITVLKNKNESFFNTVLTALRNNDKSAIDRLLDKGTAIQDMSKGAVRVKDGEVYMAMRELSGETIEIKVDNSLTKRLVRMLEEGFTNIDPMINFMSNLSQNPSSHSVQELYEFLEVNELPLTEDGHFLAYKVVRNNFTDCHTGSMDNSVGKVVTMARASVDDNRNRTCSAGLHFCSIEYVPAFHSRGNKIVSVKVNPRDVVSIPTDYNNAKARCCRYEVVEDITEDVMGKGAGDKPKDVLSEKAVANIRMENIQNLLAEMVGSEKAEKLVKQIDTDETEE